MVFWNQRTEADRTVSLLADGGVSREVAETLRTKGLAVVRTEPSDALLRAMVFRVDPSLFGPLMPGERKEDRERKYNLALYTARCMYEEVVGQGLYQPERDQQMGSFLDRLSNPPPITGAFTDQALPPTTMTWKAEMK